MIDYVAIGQRIRRCRRWSDITQQPLAEMVGCSTSFIGHIERGSRKLSVETLCAICDALHVSADQLLGILQNSPSLAAGAVLI